jgi:hypothetical protein
MLKWGGPAVRGLFGIRKWGDDGEFFMRPFKRGCGRLGTVLERVGHWSPFKEYSIGFLSHIVRPAT